MGKANRSTLDYFRRNDIFTDLVNQGVFHGEDFVQTEYLHDDDPKALAPEFAIDKESDIVKVLCKSDNRARYLIFQLEAQSIAHLAMPVRILLYLALNYHRQCQEIASEHRKKQDLEHGSVEFLSKMSREDRLIPIIPIVLYLKSGKWDGPRSLHEML